MKLSARFVVYFLFLIAISVPIIVSTGLQAWGEFYDDAFITFRYADNLARGEGLVWNSGEDPTEGFTSLLHVLLLVPLMSLGMEALDASRLIGLVFLLAISLTLYLVSIRNEKSGKAAALTVPTIMLMTPASILLVMVGLETIPFTFLLLVSVILSAKTLSATHTSQWYRPITLALVWFLLALMRPEGLIVIFAVWAIAIIKRIRRSEVHLVELGRATLLFLIPSLFYLVWKWDFFGGLLPNPFFIKSSGFGISPLGLNSVLLFFDNYAGLIALAFAALALVFGQRKWNLLSGSNINENLITLSITVVFVYTAFYLRTDTLMDIQGRFLFPLLPIVLLIASPLLTAGSVYLFKVRTAFFPSSILALGIAIVVLSGANWGSLRASYFPESFSNALRTSMAQFDGDKQLELANVLSEYSNIEGTKIAYGDAGKIPFFTRAPWLDPVGLNDTFLAQSTSLGDSVDYFFAWEPDLILMPVSEDGTPISYGHGLLGDYAAWKDDARWKTFDTLGTIKRSDTPYSLEVRVRRESPLREPLGEFIERRVLTISPN